MATAVGTVELPSSSKAGDPIRVELRDVIDVGVKSQTATNEVDHLDQHISVELCSLVSGMSVTETMHSLLGVDNKMSLESESTAAAAATDGNLEQEFARFSLEDGLMVADVSGQVKIKVNSEDCKSSGVGKSSMLSVIEVPRRRCDPQEQVEPEDDDDSDGKKPELVNRGPTGGVAIHATTPATYYGYQPAATLQPQYNGVQQPLWHHPVNNFVEVPPAKFRRPMPSEQFPTSSCAVALPNVQQMSTYNTARHLTGGTVMFDGSIPNDVGFNNAAPNDGYLAVQPDFDLPARTSINSLVDELLGHNNGNSSLQSGDYDDLLQRLSATPQISVGNTTLLPQPSYPLQPVTVTQHVSVAATAIATLSMCEAPFQPGIDSSPPISSPFTDVLSECPSPVSLAATDIAALNLPLPFVDSPDSGLGDNEDADLDKLIDEFLDIEQENNQLAAIKQQWMQQQQQAPVALPTTVVTQCCQVPDFQQLMVTASTVPVGSDYFGMPPRTVVSGPQSSHSMPCYEHPVQVPSPVVSTSTMQATANSGGVLPFAGSQLSPTGGGGSVIQFTPVTCCIIVPPISSTATTKQRPLKEIRPKPAVPERQSGNLPNGTSPSNRMSPLPFIPSAIPNPRPNVDPANENQRTVQIYRLVAGFKEEELVHQDAEGDTLLHLAVAKDEYILIEALLSRLGRQGLTHHVINLPNMQQHTPLCMAVFANNAANVRRLIEAGANANWQLQRQQPNNMGLLYFRLVHFIASRGLAWTDTLEALLEANNIDLHQFNWKGQSPLHCAINAHGEKCSPDSTIDSRRTIYLLVCHGANLALQDGLSGKTPLHCVVEKKNVDFLSWYLDLVRHFSDQRCTDSSYLRSIVNARMNANGPTPLHVAAAPLPDHATRADHDRRARITQLLLLNGAKLSPRTDGPLRKELSKIPEIAELVKNACGSRSNSRS